MSAAAASPIPIQSERGNRNPESPTAIGAYKSIRHLAGKLSGEDELQMVLEIIDQTFALSRKKDTLAPKHSRPLTLRVFMGRVGCSRTHACNSLKRMAKAGLIEALTPKQGRDQGYPLPADSDPQAKRYRCLIENWPGAALYEAAAPKPKPVPEPDEPEPLPPAAQETRELGSGKRFKASIPPTTKFTVECGDGIAVRIATNHHEKKGLHVLLLPLAIEPQINTSTPSEKVPVFNCSSTVESAVTAADPGEFLARLRRFVAPILLERCASALDDNLLHRIAKELQYDCPIESGPDCPVSFEARLLQRAAVLEKKRQPLTPVIVQCCATDARKAWEEWQEANHGKLQAEEARKPAEIVREIVQAMELVENAEAGAGRDTLLEELNAKKLEAPALYRRALAEIRGRQ